MVTNRLIIAMITASVLLVVGLFVIYTEKCAIDGEMSIQDTLDLMKTQCIRYDNLVASEQAGDQIHLLDKVLELRRHVEGTEGFSQQDLDTFSENMRLSGAILLDNNLNPLLSTLRDQKTTLDDWSTLKEDENLTNVLNYPKKNYVSSISFAGQDYDYAAIGLTDGSGMLLCFARETQNAIDDYQIGIENMLSGYQLEEGGLLFITDGETVLSSNDPDMQGHTVSECPMLSENIEKISSDGMASIFSGTTRYLARSSKYRNYYLYAFLSASAVYRSRTIAIVYVLVLYILVGLILAILRQRETQHSNQAKMDFLHHMSHDIRTPINGIRGMVRIANCFPDDMHKQKECRDKIWQSSDFLMDLVNDVLDMGKIESGEIHLDQQPFDMRAQLDSIMGVLENQTHEHNIKLTLAEPEGEHWYLIGSAVHLRRILVNLLTNAIKYNRIDGTVTLTCREIDCNTPGKARFEFICADTGVGMTREFQKKMFEQFTQENAIGEVSHHGTGLGLSIVKSLVDEMEGTIRCESKPDVGTTFTVTLPFLIDENAVGYQSADAAASTDQAVEEDDSNLEGVSILLVEDNELNMEVAEFLLEDEGAKITEAWNGLEAVETFQKSMPGDFDVILMDMMMPVMDGETATKTIRSLDHEDAKTIPILAMTANAFAEDVQLALNAGMNAHLAKPIDPDLLKKEILKQLRIREEKMG
jgi:signal transduction histidine kinase/CheY-like chemotaxis protein